MTFFPERGERDTFGQVQPAAPTPPPRLTLRQRAGAFWLNFLFWSAGHVPWLARLTVHFWIWAAWVFSPALRRNTMETARMVLGERSTPRQRRRLSRAIIRSSFMFVYDVGRSSAMTVEQMEAEVESITGQSHYDDARRLKRGVILATAHFGTFEAAMVALVRQEAKVHVVFRRDRFGQFDAIRSRLHARLGVIESPIDDGIAAWVRIKAALERDEAVLMQADRVMPGQKGIKVPFCGGRIEAPLGPAKLAWMTGAPILPIFAVRLPSGRVRVEIQPAILINSDDNDDNDDNENPLTPTVLKITEVIERYVRQYPEQWLVLHRPWCEEKASA